MDDEIYDDPKQILVILNSLGVVGVTTSELKAFMKELKAYKKAKRKVCQQSKEKTKIKILQKQEFDRIQQMYDSKYTTIEKTLKRQEQDYIPKHNKINNAQNDCTEIYINRPLNISHNKENNVVNDRILISLENHKNLKNKSPCKKLQKQIQDPEKIDKPSVRTSRNEKKLVVELSPIKSKTTEVPTSSRKSENTESYSRSKSFIRPQIPYTESRSSLPRKKMTDPVTLYKKYKDFWDQLSIPGEETHTKLRWAVREKTLGRHPVPKPVIPHKIALQRSNAFKKK